MAVVSFDVKPGKQQLPILIVDGVRHMPDAYYYDDLVCVCGSFYPCEAVREHDPRGVEWTR